MQNQADWCNEHKIQYQNFKVENYLPTIVQSLHHHVVKKDYQAKKQQWLQ